MTDITDSALLFINPVTGICPSHLKTVQLGFVYGY